uniref:Glycosyltransferase n=1 Tax=Fagopyrum esculentum TaxID=3617 RepID=A0A0A1H7N8_FAGES|nr:UDP-glycose: glycosyltransferase UGT88J1 [Fagopyrum esculentum]
MEEAIVFYSAPGMGHIVSMAELANLIRRHLLLHYPNRRVSFTVIYGSQPFEPPTTTTAISQIANSSPSISFLHLPQHPINTFPARSPAAMAFESIRKSAPDFAESLRRISDAGTKIRSLVIDLFCGTALPIAAEQGIPVYYFFTSGSAALAAYLHMPTIHQRVGGRVFKDSPDLLIDIPGLPSIPADEMPEPLLDAKDPAYPEMVYFCECLQKSKGILVNTFDELEPVVTREAIDSGACVPDGPTPAVYNIGPLIEGSKDGDTSHETLSWLNTQPSGSVVFLCFGSRGRFTAAQTKAIAEGLERSGQRFIWVVRNPPDDNSSEIDLGKLLPEGFLRRTKDIGIVVKGWAPQVAVLSHDSVGGFVTHCGWNSVLEAVVAGKPMVAWPLYAEQHLNRAVLVKTMGMAVPVEQREGDRFVSGDELASRLIELMNSEKGKEMKEKSRLMRDKALAARNEGGSSMADLQKVVNEWMK